MGRCCVMGCGRMVRYGHVVGDCRMELGFVVLRGTNGVCFAGRRGLDR